LSNEPIKDAKLLLPILHYAQNKNCPLIIIAPYFDEIFHTLYTQNVEKKILSGATIVAPGGTKQSIEDNLIDIAALTGGKVYGIDITDLSQWDCDKDFGTAEGIKIYPARTIITGSVSDQEKLDKRCEEIRITLKENDNADENSLSPYEISILKTRLARMTGGIATIFVGGISEIELKEKKDRYEDAVNAVRSAIKEGIVPGAGVALLRAAKAVEDLNLDFKDREIENGFKTFLEVCKEPARQIVKPTGKDPSLVIAKTLDNDSYEFGFNSNTEEFCNLFEEGVIDPVKVPKTALTFAHSVASTFVSTDTVVIDEVNNSFTEPVDPIMNEYNFDEE
jgi:chaperonin GroEL